MKNLHFILGWLLLYSVSTTAQELITYNTIPGRPSSDHYNCRVKFVNEPASQWREVFVLQTQAKDNGDEAYFEILRGWTASWIAFESDYTNGGVIVEISKKDGSPITEAMVRPVGDASPATISNGKAYVTFNEPANVNVDINGQMENNYTGFEYTGPDVHTISLFANPVFEIPDTNDPQVRVLQTWEDINTLDRNSWQTIIFAPGIHNIGMPFEILSDETLFIPGDAIIKGTIHPKNAWGINASKNFKVYGSGTLSGEDIFRLRTDQSLTTKPFTYQAEGALLEGFVIADPAYHSFNMNHSSGIGPMNVYKNLKILAWRVNSDGINAFRHSEVYDCFFRVQDDAFYLGQTNVVQHDNVVWNDANGSVLFIQNILDGSTNVFRDIKVIYHRAQWHWWEGGRIISMRERFPGVTIRNVHVKNVLVEDPLPAFPPFYSRIEPGNDDNMYLSNITIENVRQDHPGVSSTLDVIRGKPRNTIRGLDNTRIFENIHFKNCHYNGVDLNSFEDGDFFTEFIDPNTIIFNNLSDYFIDISAPSQVERNETITVNVNYSAKQTRDLNAYIQLNAAPWTVYGSTTVNVPAGVDTKDIDIAVSASTPLSNGNYRIVVNLLPTAGVEANKLDQIFTTNVSVVESGLSTQTFENIGVQIFPNPSSVFTNIKSNFPLKSIKLFSLEGKIIYENHVEQAHFNLDVSSFSKGFYFLQVSNTKGTATKKLVVN